MFLVTDNVLVCLIFTIIGVTSKSLF